MGDVCNLVVFCTLTLNALFIGINAIYAILGFFMGSPSTKLKCLALPVLKLRKRFQNLKKVST